MTATTDEAEQSTRKTSIAIATGNLMTTLLGLPTGPYGSASASWTRPDGTVVTVTLSLTKGESDDE